MTKPNQNKIPVSGETSVPDLNNPFARLEVNGLPDAPPETLSPASAQPSETKRKGPPLGRVVLRREKAHRGGKTVIVVHDFATHLSLSFIDDLGKRLRKSCGCGGTVKERTIEIQGDQPGKIRQFLEEEGFRVAGVS